MKPAAQSAHLIDAALALFLFVRYGVEEVRWPGMTRPRGRR